MSSGHIEECDLLSDSEDVMQYAVCLGPRATHMAAKNKISVNSMLYINLSAAFLVMAALSAGGTDRHVLNKSICGGVRLACSSAVSVPGEC